MNNTYGAWRLVASREVVVRIRSKAFWVSSAAMIVLVLAGALALHLSSGRDTTYKIAVTTKVDASMITSADVAPAKAQDSSSTSGQVKFTPILVGDRDAAKKLAQAGDADIALVPSERGSGWTLISRGQPDAAVTDFVARTAQVFGLTSNAQRLGVPLADVLKGTSLELSILSDDTEKKSVQLGLTFAFGLLFFMSCQLFGITIASSVVEEKESRVIEVLLSALPTRSVLLGKVLANAALGVAQMVVFLAVALAAALALGQVPYLGEIVMSSGWFMLYYVVGFLTMCFLFGGLGALASRTQDMQAATAPLQLIITATYMISVFPKGAVITVASFLPIASTVTMPSRIFAGDVRWWEVVISLTASVAFAVASVWIADRAYASSVLKTGARLSLSKSLRAQATGMASS
jgi:ABC-2 type transport system permease protein